MCYWTQHGWRGNDTVTVHSARGNHTQDIGCVKETNRISMLYAMALCYKHCFRIWWMGFLILCACCAECLLLRKTSQFSVSGIFLYRVDGNSNTTLSTWIQSKWAIRTVSSSFSAFDSNIYFAFGPFWRWVSVSAQWKRNAAHVSSLSWSRFHQSD